MATKPNINSQEYRDGYEAALEALRKKLNGDNSGDGSSNSSLSGGSGGSSGGSSGGGKGGGKNAPKGTDGQPMQAPELNSADKKRAAKNATGQSEASISARKEAAQNGGSVGGMLSQETGAEIAKSEGYSQNDCEVVSASRISNQWEQAVIKARTANNSPGLGAAFSAFTDYYTTSRDWKSDLKNLIGRALSKVNTETKLGKHKWLAMGEIKKYDKKLDNDLSDVIFMIDCSGSIDDDLLQRLISECFTIVKKKNISKVTYCYYDNGIRQVDTNDSMKFDGVMNPKMINVIKANKKPSSEIHGRGGNDEALTMKELQEVLQKSHKHPELVMWFTDGWTNTVPAKPKDIKHMIWVVYVNREFKTPDDSKVIHINPDEIGKR